MLRGSAALAGSAFLAHLFPARLLHASAAGLCARSAFGRARGYARLVSTPFPSKQKGLVKMSPCSPAPGGKRGSPQTAPTAKFVVDTFVAPAWPRLKEALDGPGQRASEIRH